MVRVKVCGLTSFEQAMETAALGADALGFVRAKESTRFFADFSVLSGVRVLLPTMPLVAVYADYWGDPELCRFDVAQAVDLDTDRYLSGIRVVRVQESDTVESVLERAGRGDLVLLDAYHAQLGGGTGERVDWGLAAEFVAAFSGRVILAGGLGADNVGDAVRKVNPWMVDASSRLEVSPGVKDLDLVKGYIESAKSAGR